MNDLTKEQIQFLMDDLTKGKNQNLIAEGEKRTAWHSFRTIPIFSEIEMRALRDAWERDWPGVGRLERWLPPYESAYGPVQRMADAIIIRQCTRSFLRALLWGPT